MLQCSTTHSGQKEMVDRSPRASTKFVRTRCYARNWINCSLLDHRYIIYHHGKFMKLRTRFTHLSPSSLSLTFTSPHKTDCPLIPTFSTSLHRPFSTVCHLREFTLRA